MEDPRFLCAMSSQMKVRNSPPLASCVEWVSDRDLPAAYKMILTHMSLIYSSVSLHGSGRDKVEASSNKNSFRCCRMTCCFSLLPPPVIIAVNLLLKTSSTDSALVAVICNISGCVTRR
jgi:hypothetical protein